MAKTKRTARPATLSARIVDKVSTTPADVFKGEESITLSTDDDGRHESTNLSTVSGDGDGERGERDDSTNLSTVSGDGDGDGEREMTRQTCRLSLVMVIMMVRDIPCYDLDESFKHLLNLQPDAMLNKWLDTVDKL
jgi:hypothetical protein